MTFLSTSGPLGVWASDPTTADGAVANASERRDVGAELDSETDGGASTPLAEHAGARSDRGVSTLVFESTTAPAGLGYQPKNVGAIWVADESGKLVRTLEVWAGTRLIFLVAYNRARAGASVDVETQATLPNHRLHHVSWDLKDKSAASVAPGKYKLMLELNDGEAIGKTTSLEVDTSAGPATLLPPDAACYRNMKLELR